METNKIYQGDCLELMKQIEDKSVDMILCDLPYGTTACKWDTIIPFEPLWEQYKRIIKDNGTIVLTASQPFTSALVMSNVKMFKYEWVWIKNKVTKFLSVKTQPLQKTESILVFYNDTSVGINDVNKFIELRNYFASILKDNGLTKKRIIKDIGQSADHCFRFNSSQWMLPTEETYGKIKSKYNLQLRSYAELEAELEAEFKKNSIGIRYNPQGIKKFETKKINNGKKKKEGDVYNFECDKYEQEFTNYPTNVLEFNTDIGLHPTQKPVALFEYLIKTYTNEGDLVLDNCIGSGTTAIACVNTKRNFIGIELSAEYCEIANKRLAELESQSNDCQSPVGESEDKNGN